MIFISNTALSLIVGTTCYGSGPVRYTDTGDTYKVLLVDDSGVLATLFQVVKTSVVGEEDTPIIMVKDER